MVLENVSGVDFPRFGPVVRLPADGPGEVLGIAQREAPVATNSLRALHGIHVFLDRAFDAVAERPRRIRKPRALDQLARCSTVFGGL